MASETQVSGSLQSTKNGLQVVETDSISIDLAGNNIFAAVQVIGITAEQVSIASDMTDVRYWKITNLDDTNYVELGLDSAVSTSKFSKLQPGDFAVIPPNSGSMAIYAKANTASCSIKVVAVGT